MFFIINKISTIVKPYNAQQTQNPDQGTLDVVAVEKWKIHNTSSLFIAGQNAFKIKESE